MPINPNIALSFQQPQIENPLNAYAKAIGIQNAQQQNQLAKFQMENALREQQSNNALNEAYRSSFNAEIGGIDKNALLRNLAERGQGRQIPGVQKMFAEQEEAGLKRDKARTDLVGERMKLSRAGLEGVSTPEEYIAWHEANHKDPVLGEYLASRGITADQARGRIMQKIQQPGGFDQLLMESKLGADKALEQHFAQFDTGTQVGTLVMPKYGKGAARVVSGSVQNKTIQPNYDVKETDSGLVAVNTRNPADAQRVTLGGQPIMPKMPESQKKEIMSINQQRSILQGAINEVDKTPDAFSLGRGLAQNMPLGETLAGRTETPAQTAARAYVFNNVSRIINERAGAAQSAQELQRLNSFLPAPTDNAQQIKNKLEGFKKYLEDLEAGTRGKPTQPAENKFTGQDKDALDWANSNPNDPRAAKIKERLGVK